MKVPVLWHNVTLTVKLTFVFFQTLAWQSLLRLMLLENLRPGLSDFKCDTCGCLCALWISVFHQRTHLWWEICVIDGSLEHQCCLSQSSSELQIAELSSSWWDDVNVTTVECVCMYAAQVHHWLTFGQEAGDSVWRSRSHENWPDYKWTCACHQHGNDQHSLVIHYTVWAR